MEPLTTLTRLLKQTFSSEVLGGSLRRFNSEDRARPSQINLNRHRYAQHEFLDVVRLALENLLREVAEERLRNLGRWQFSSRGERRETDYCRPAPSSVDQRLGRLARTFTDHRGSLRGCH